MEEDRQRGLNEWRTPIEFYGKVVDENTNAVAGASVHFVWTDLSADGSSEKDATSDQDGLFSLSNVSGKNLIVRVSKEGYYAYQRFGVAFNYAGENQNFIPNVANPVIFQLKKKGEAEPLIMFAKTFSISISGKPLELNLKTGQTVPVGQGDLMLEFIRTPLEETTNRNFFDWSLKLTPRNGGLIASTREFDFVAPEHGYQPIDLIDMPVSLAAEWQGHLRRQYFLRFADGNYARIRFDLRPSNGSLKIESFLNPSGSRNLEFDPAVQPKPTTYE